MSSTSKSTSRPLVQVERLTKLYPLRRGLFAKPSLLHAVDGVDFYVRRGETLGLVGESGSGKSTLARVLMRLSEPTFGRIAFDGREITHLRGAELRALRKRMQLVFQDPYGSLNPRMTLREIVAEGIEIFGLAKTRSAVDDKVAEVLRRVGVRADMMGRYPHELSGGQRQRVGIARAIAVGPDFLVCDEPVSALDLSVQAQIINLLTDLQETMSLAMLFISHDLRVVSWVSHRIAVMHLGRLVEVGPSSEIAKRRFHPYTRALFAAAPGQAQARASLPVVADPPSAIDPPPGCSYFSRCSQAEKGRCDVESPRLEEVIPGSHHRVACFHPHLENVPPPREMAKT